MCVCVLCRPMYVHVEEDGVCFSTRFYLISWLGCFLYYPINLYRHHLTVMNVTLTSKAKTKSPMVILLLLALNLHVNCGSCVYGLENATVFDGCNLTSLLLLRQDESVSFSCLS